MNDIINDGEERIALNHVKLGKSVGIDLVLTEVLRIVPVYTFWDKLFNMCFKYGITPSAWQKGIINLIAKSVD